MTNISLTKSELAYLRQAMNEVCNGSEAIEEWEFSLRMGLTRYEAIELMAKVEKILDQPSDI